MGKDKADKNPRKRLRENGSQTDEDDEHVGVGGARLRRPIVSQASTRPTERIRAITYTNARYK